MALYTTDEILDDIFIHEGVKVVFTRPACATVLYSEVYPKTPSGKAVDVFLDKVNDYMETYCPLPLDHPPADDPELHTLYAGSDQTILEKGYIRIGSLVAGDDEEYHRLLDKITNDKNTLMVLDYQCKMIISLNRRVH